MLGAKCTQLQMCVITILIYLITELNFNHELGFIELEIKRQTTSKYDMN